MSGANKRNKELFLKEKRKIFPWSLRIGSVSGHCPNTQAVDDSAWASLLTCRAWKAARDESLVFSNLFWVCVSLMAWRGFLDSLAYMEALKSKSRPRHLSFPIFLSQASWSITCPSVPCPTWLRPVAVPINACSKSHLESYLALEISWMNSKPFHLSLREPPDRLASTTTVLWK